MSRRSTRLESTGYYDSEGTPIISYKETPHKIVRRRRNSSVLSRGRNRKGSYSYCYCYSYFSRSSESRSSESNSRRSTMFYLFGFLFFMLCFGFAYLSSNILYSRPKDSPVLPTILHMDWNARGKDMAKQLQDLQDSFLRLKEKMNYLLPDADTWPNFALESQGARVLFQQTSQTYQTKDTGMSFFGIPIWNSRVSPRTVIQGNSRWMPGCCWAFAGGHGHLSIALSYAVTISHVTLGHMAKSMSPTGAITSAPKEFSVYGMKTPDDEGTKLGTFLYDQDGDSAQTFKIPDHKKDVFSYVKLQVDSNWGNLDYTCLYSFKVHGKLAD